MEAKLQAFAGVLAFLLISWLLGSRKTPSWSWLGTQLLAILVWSFVLHKFNALQEIGAFLSSAVSITNAASDRAAAFMFGYLGGGGTPFQVQNAEALFVIAFRVMPLILVISAWSSLLYYLGILPLLINALAFALRRGFRVSGVLAFGAAASVFFGTIETPLLVKPYIDRMSRSDLFALLCCTMATVAGSVLVLYSSVLGSVVDNPAQHLLNASLISVPAALLLARMMMPSEKSETSTDQLELAKNAEGPMDALLKGTADGLHMILHITAVIIVLFATIHVIDLSMEALFGSNASWMRVEKVTAYLLTPFLWLIGIPASELSTASNLMATKIVLNEFVAFLNLSQLQNAELSPRSTLIMTYALCGFANLASLGIISGGLGALFPKKRQEILALSWRSLIVGNLASLFSACLFVLVS